MTNSRMQNSEGGMWEKNLIFPVFTSVLGGFLFSPTEIWQALTEKRNKHEFKSNRI